MTNYICFYTNNKFRDRENHLIQHYKNNGFNNIIPYHSEDIKIGEFYDENKIILDCATGDGYWLWKPKIILDAFQKMDYGDVIIYVDAGDLFYGTNDSITTYFETHDYYFSNWGGNRQKQKIATKRDCFILMGCDESKYHEAIQIEAGFLIFKKTDKMIQLLNEYLKYCKVKEIVDNEPNIHGPNFDNWQHHRNDQSILTNLIVRDGLSFSTAFDNLILCNIYRP